MNPSFKACEKHTYIVPEDGDPRWQQIFEQAPRVTCRFHGPLPAGNVSDLCVMLITRTILPGVGYDETVYFANPSDVARWNAPKTLKILDRCRDGVFWYETVLKQNTSWTIAQLLDYVEERVRRGVS